ncbi:DNA-binding transcriptional regulator, AcrR family [Amycolatopsis tolypomycina]|uniref:DNA-binding transcriptional regulator, AcrR family n=1 Tax=Amycolatopsis tolypomycina TaxID=208445 RepID=A0A1H5DJX2_9PSEU|nr:TetR family transcriptional regulator [Amycolatopsis tolypomycina]SED79126.1 DNA-binding transcriptional regulator, AcrR family [Amycolatopsis tolypomycina]
MTSSPSEPAGLRERKKARTRAAIQRHALRLFHEQGYSATTVDQIAAAAEISPSTFFRYFPTKEATVLYDPFDPLLIEAAVGQSAALSPIGALRATMTFIREQLPAEEWEAERQRQGLVFREPELRSAVMDKFAEGIDVLADLAARRTGRAADDFEVRNWAGAVVGVVLAAFLGAAADPEADMLLVIDQAVAHLDAGLPL